jgi:hypothetical protein
MERGLVFNFSLSPKIADRSLQRLIGLRIPKTSKRFGYKTLKKHLRKEEIIIKEEPLPF